MFTLKLKRNNQTETRNLDTPLKLKLRNTHSKSTSGLEYKATLHSNAKAQTRDFHTQTQTLNTLKLKLIEWGTTLCAGWIETNRQQYMVRASPSTSSQIVLCADRFEISPTDRTRRADSKKTISGLWRQKKREQKVQGHPGIHRAADRHSTGVLKGMWDPNGKTKIVCFEQNYLGAPFFFN